MSLLGLLLLAGGVVVLFLVLRRGKSDAPTSGAAPATPVSRPSSRARDTFITPVSEENAEESAVADTAAQDPLPAALAEFRLLQANDLDDATHAQIRELCESLPEPHPINAQLAGGLDEPEALMELVSTDAGLTASVLRTVNSAAFSLTSPISSVQHAITYLGVSFVKGLVAQAAVSENLQDGTPGQLDAIGRIWKSASIASAVAQALGQELGMERPSVLATKALFFNLGDVALVMGREESHSWYTGGLGIVDRLRAQQEASACNSAVVGAALARHWQLPEEIAQALEGGLLPLTQAPGTLSMKGDEQQAAVLLFLASRIGDRVTYAGLRDVGELDLDSREEPGLFHLKGHLEHAGLGRVPALLQDPAFRRKVNRLLATIAS